MPIINQIGIVLAGGRSTRMGQDKAKLCIDGISLLERSRRMLYRLGCDHVIMSGADRPEWPDAVIHDATRGLGPVSGLVSVTHWASAQNMGTSTMVFIPVDTPLLSNQILEELIDRSKGFDGCYVSGSPLPLVLNLTQATREQARRAVPDMALSQAWSIKRFIQPLHMKAIQLDMDNARMLSNVNTPDQWETLIHEITPSTGAYPVQNIPI